MKRLAGLGCLVLLGGIGVVGIVLYQMGLLPYAVLYAKILFGLATNPEVKPANWAKTEAQVLQIEHWTDEHYRPMAKVTLRYADASGQEQVGTFEVFSPSRSLGRTRNNDRLSIQVCRYDGSIVKSDRFVMAERRKCAPGGGR